MWYVCDVLYVVLYVCVCCFVVCGCGCLEEVCRCFAIEICLVLLMCTLTI